MLPAEDAQRVEECSREGGKRLDFTLEGGRTAGAECRARGSQDRCALSHHGLVISDQSFSAGVHAS